MIEDGQGAGGGEETDKSSLRMEEEGEEGRKVEEETKLVPRRWGVQ